MARGARSSDGVWSRHCQIVASSSHRTRACDIAAVLGLHVESVRRILRTFNASGLDAIRSQKRLGPVPAQTGEAAVHPHGEYALRATEVDDGAAIRPRGGQRERPSVDARGVIAWHGQRRFVERHGDVGVVGRSWPCIVQLLGTDVVSQSPGGRPSATHESSTASGLAASRNSHSPFRDAYHGLRSRGPSRAASVDGYG